MPIHVHFSSDFDRKVGQTDLVFGVQQWLISRHVHARLQFFCVQHLQFVPPWFTTDYYIWTVTLKYVKPEIIMPVRAHIRCTCTYDANLVATGQ